MKSNPSVEKIVVAVVSLLGGVCLTSLFFVVLNGANGFRTRNDVEAGANSLSTNESRDWAVRTVVQNPVLEEMWMFSEFRPLVQNCIRNEIAARYAFLMVRTGISHEEQNSVVKAILHREGAIMDVVNAEKVDVSALASIDKDYRAELAASLAPQTVEKWLKNEERLSTWTKIEALYRKTTLIKEPLSSEQQEQLFAIFRSEPVGKMPLVADHDMWQQFLTSERSKRDRFILTAKSHLSHVQLRCLEEQLRAEMDYAELTRVIQLKSPHTKL